MAFKLNNPPYYIDNTPIYKTDLGDDVLGKADKNGSILINKNVTDQKLVKDIIKHEKVHLDQMAQGRLQYSDSSVIWKRDTKSPAKVYRRADMNEGHPDFEWEKEAYKK